MTDDAKKFPMQHGPAIPWDLAEVIYKAYAALYGSTQSLERLAARGGFGWHEVEVIGADYRRRFGRLPDGWSH